MKYPKEQFEILKSALKQIRGIIDFKPSEGYLHNLHYTIFQQSSPGQTHNRLYINAEGQIKRAHAIGDIVGSWRPLIVIPDGFELYPAGCDDSHITTAMKRAIKEVA